MTYSRVAIVGKPNVGKSTLFNRLCKRRFAIVTTTAGTTRDRKETMVELGDAKFMLIDTAGWEGWHHQDTLKSSMMEQTKYGIADADLVLFMVDGKAHLSADDIEFSDLIRKSGKKVLVLVNKSESKITPSLNDLMKLGFGEPVYIAAEHALGLDALYESIINTLPGVIEQDDANAHNSLALAIIGRPNAGKSTIFNQLLGFQRSITSADAGTTRDSITYSLEVDGQAVSLIDTAGLRKRGKIHEEIEKLSVGQTIASVRRANVVALVIDALQGFEQQDLTIAQMVINEGKGLVLVFNKYDLIKDRKKLDEDIEYIFEHYLTDITSVPTIYTNAIKGVNIQKVVSTAIEVYGNWSRTITTAKLNKWLAEVTTAHQPSFSSEGRRIKFKYITQVSSKPPTFKAFVNLPSAVTRQYLRYLNHALQDHFHFSGIPIRLSCTTTDNPYSTDK